MEYQEIIKFFENTPSQPSKLRTKNWVERNDASYGADNTGSQIKFKSSMIRSSLCDYSDAYILIKGTITVENTGTATVSNKRNKKVIFKNCSPFTDCISEIKNKEIDHPKNIDVVIPMYNLRGYSDNYLKTSGSLWQYYEDEPFIDNNDNIIDVPDDPDSA